MEPQKSKTKRGGKSKRGKRIIKRILLFLLMIVLLGGIGVFAYARLQQEYTTTYQEYTATTGTISNSLSFSGTLQVINNTTYTASSAATVRAVHVSAGQDVREGDLLLRLSNGQSIQAEFDGRINQFSVQLNFKVTVGSC